MWMTGTIGAPTIQRGKKGMHRGQVPFGFREGFKKAAREKDPEQQQLLRAGATNHLGLNQDHLICSMGTKNVSLPVLMYPS
jgi:hypothetical protein